jgi:hypothetical protein
MQDNKYIFLNSTRIISESILLMNACTHPFPAIHNSYYRSCIKLRLLLLVYK